MNLDLEFVGLANTYTNGEFDALCNTINECLVEVSSGMPRLTEYHNIFQLTDPQPADLIISVHETEVALKKVKVNKSTGPDNVSPWILRDFADIMAAPLGAIYNRSLR